MLAEGSITQNEWETLSAQDVVTNPKPLRRGTSHLYDKVVELTREIVGDDAMSRGGFNIFTTVDRDVQTAANDTLRQHLLQIEKHPDYTHPLFSEHDRTSGKPPVYLQGAVLAIDSSTGAVIAHVGGREFRHSQYDFIESGRRPLGTAFLPFVYAAAFENGSNPATRVDDLPLDAREVMLGGTEGILGEWGPEIMDPIYQGEITLRQALRNSKIASTVRVGVDVGLAAVASQSKKFGLPLESGELLSRLLLGWEQNSLWQAVRAYSAFARNGRAPDDLYYIDRIENVDGQLIYTAPQSKAATREVCDSATAYQIHSILADNLSKGNLTEIADTLLEPELAVVKSGTNYNFSDGWALGYNGTLTCGVWVGFFEGRKPIYEFAFGKDLAIPVWSQIMNAASTDFPGQNLTRPPTLKTINLCSTSGRKVTRYCYESVFDPELGLSLVSTAYPEYVRVTDPEIGLCPVHGSGGVTPSMAFAPDTDGARQRRLSVSPLWVTNNALLGNDPYNSVVLSIPEKQT
ncbi:MAG: penicillin-binding transpeptidase domain-containing protein, partial [Verrucomicrobiota bacterium]